MEVQVQVGVEVEVEVQGGETAQVRVIGEMQLATIVKILGTVL